MNPNQLLPENLRALLSQNQNPEFDAALSAEAIARAQAFMAGVKLYRQHPAHRDVEEAPVIWQKGSTCLRDYAAHAPREMPIVLIVPSLINRFYILDLDHDHSFARMVALAGFRPLIVDWDEPGVIEKNFTIDDYFGRLEEIVSWIGQPVHLLGYCMGGLLALALAAARRAAIKTMILMAAPWDFHQPDEATGTLLGELAEQWKPGLKSAGEMPVDVIQYLFALLQPFHTVKKFMDFSRTDADSPEARSFVLLEDWLNDGVPLPVPVARTCLKEWYGENRTGNLTWKVGGHLIDPRQLAMPSYVVVPGRDRIVPPESALPLVKLLPHATLHEPMSGHIGMLASHGAPLQVWRPLLHWLDEHR